MADPIHPSSDSYAGYSRFELENEFVQSLSNPQYVLWLGTEAKLLNDPDFVAYLSYLQYWKRPEYSRYLLYPGTSLKMLDMLNQEPFRRDMSNDATARPTVVAMVEAWTRAANADETAPV